MRAFKRMHGLKCRNIILRVQLPPNGYAFGTKPFNAKVDTAGTALHRCSHARFYLPSCCFGPIYRTIQSTSVLCVPVKIDHHFWVWFSAKRSAYSSTMCGVEHLHRTLACTIEQWLIFLHFGQKSQNVRPEKKPSTGVGYGKTCDYHEHTIPTHRQTPHQRCSSEGNSSLADKCRSVCRGALYLALSVVDHKMSSTPSGFEARLRILPCLFFYLSTGPRSLGGVFVRPG